MIEDEKHLVKDFPSTKRKIIEKCFNYQIRKNNLSSTYGETILQKSECKNSKNNEHQTGSDKIKDFNNSSYCYKNSLKLSSIRVKPDLTHLKQGDQCEHKNDKITQNPYFQRNYNVPSMKSKRILSEKDKKNFYESLYKEKTNYLYSNNSTQKNIYQLLRTSPIKKRQNKTNCFHNSVFPSQSNPKYFKTSSQKNKKSIETIMFTLNNSNERDRIVFHTEQESLVEFIKNFVKINNKSNANEELKQKTKLDDSCVRRDYKESDVIYQSEVVTLEKELCNIHENSSSQALSLAESQKIENSAVISELYISDNTELQFWKSDVLIINPNNCHTSLFKSKIVKPKIKYEIYNDMKKISKSNSNILCELFEHSYINKHVVIADSLKGQLSNDIGLICNICGDLFSSYSIHIHYYTCLKKWKRISTMFSQDISLPELPNFIVNKLEYKILEINGMKDSHTLIPQYFNHCVNENIRSSTKNLANLDEAELRNN